MNLNVKIIVIIITLLFLSLTCLCCKSMEKHNNISHDRLKNSKWNNDLPNYNNESICNMPKFSKCNIDDLINYVLEFNYLSQSAKEEIINRGKDPYVITKLNNILNRNSQIKSRLLLESILLAMNDKRDDRIKYILDEMKTGNTGDLINCNTLKYIDPIKEKNYIDNVLTDFKNNSEIRDNYLCILSYWYEDNDVKMYLFELLDNGVPSVRANACTTIGLFTEIDSELKCNMEILDKLIKCTKDENPDVRNAACISLKMHNECYDVVKILWNIYDNDSDVNVKLAALTALIDGVQPNEILPILKDWLINPKCEGCDFAVLSLVGELGSEAKELVPIIEDKYLNSNTDYRNEPEKILEFQEAYYTIMQITGTKPEITKNLEYLVNK